ncbi:MAG: hypothetical protein H0X66_09335 [Verrucomicrobia bacterium]|nr:hypothetical protein [Verrucomicrobiota bacterium]
MRIVALNLLKPAVLKSVGFSMALVVSAVLFSGCAGYKVGPTNGMAAKSRSIQVNPFQNQTQEPRLTDYATHSLRKRLQQDGTYALDTKDSGDVVVTGVIVGFRRSELAFQPSDVRTVRDYYLHMTAQVQAVDRSSGKVLLNRQVTGRTSIRVGADLSSAERQAVPLLADDLARNVTSLLVDGTW